MKLRTLTLGCKVNQYETEFVREGLLSIGYEDANDDDTAELCVVNTCTVTNEGDVQVAVQPYEIPLRVMLPRRDEVENLLVPVCLSASHVAYSSVRMEPQYMILGQAAGVAAKMAIDGKTSVQDMTRGLP